MRIALCDDERAEVTRLHALIEDYALKKDYQIRAECFVSGEELVKQDRFDLYILDYKMEPMDGIETARALNEKFGGAVTVCYLTNYENAAADIINGQIYADGFLKKPVEPQLLYEKLEKFYKTSFGGRLELKQGRSLCTVYTRDIVYIEAKGKTSAVRFCSGEETLFTHLLSEMETLLAESRLFYRIHRSYIVNMMYVESYDTKSVTLRGGITLPLKAKDFQKAYREYIFRQLP